MQSTTIRTGNILVIMIFILLRNTVTKINNDALVDEKDDEEDEEHVTQ